MLVLSRKETESIMVGSRIQITVLSISGSRVRLGIDAPDSVPVVRTELRAADFEPDGVKPGDISPGIK